MVVAFQMEEVRLLVEGTVVDVERLHLVQLAYTGRTYRDLDLQKLGEACCSGQLSMDNPFSFSFSSRDVCSFRTNIYPFSPIWFP